MRFYPRHKLFYGTVSRAVVDNDNLPIVLFGLKIFVGTVKGTFIQVVEFVVSGNDDGKFHTKATPIYESHSNDANQTHELFAGFIRGIRMLIRIIRIAIH